MGFLGPMPIPILGSKKTLDIQYIGQYSITNILNVVNKHVEQRYVMEAGNPTNFIPNISVLTSKHFLPIK